MTSWLNPKVEVRESQIEGKGLFAKEPIAKGERLTHGSAKDNSIIMSDKEFKAFIKTVDSYDAVALGNGKHRVSTVSRDEDPTNYGNHSCAPNAESDNRGLAARRDIAANEEVTTDYALTSSRDWSMICNCGARTCRKIVRGML